jgi:hypothetical protein
VVVEPEKGGAYPLPLYLWMNSEVRQFVPSTMGWFIEPHLALQHGKPWEIPTAEFSHLVG